jgi:Carbohydrate binding module (family 6)
LVGGHRARLMGKAGIGRFRPVTLIAFCAGVVALSVTLIMLGVSGSGGGRSVVVDGPRATRATETPSQTAAANPPAGAPADLSPPAGTAAASPIATTPAPAPRTSSAARATAPARTVVTSYEAESAANDLTGTRTYACAGCSGGLKVGNIGRGMGTLRFNGVDATSGPIGVTLAYVNGEGTRTALLSVDGAAPVSLSFPGTGGWSTVGTLDVTVTARAGGNTLTLFNTDGPAPDFDKITVTVPGR